MGGYGAVHAALIKPDVYGKVFSYSGLLDIEKRFDNPQGINTYQIFGDREKLSDNRFDIMNCLKENNLKTNVENYPEFYIRFGLSDQILTMSRQWNKYASDAGLKVNYYETAGSHDFIFWDKCIHETVNIIKEQSYRMEDIYGNSNEY